MKYLYLVQEYISNGYYSVYLIAMGSFAVICATLTVLSRNPVVSVLYLIGLFLGIAIYLITLGLTFIGLSYLLVYIGAVSILFLFIVMLINIRISELLINTFKNAFLGLITIAVLTKVLESVISFNNTTLWDHIDLEEYNNLQLNTEQSKQYQDLLPKDDSELMDFIHKSIMELETRNYYHDGEIVSESINNSIYTSWESDLLDSSDITSIGNLLYSSYSIWLIVASIILLLAMVGAIVITIKRKKKEN